MYNPQQKYQSFMFIIKPVKKEVVVTRDVIKTDPKDTSEDHPTKV